MELQGYLIVVLNFISLIANFVEHLFMFVGLLNILFYEVSFKPVSHF